MKKPSTSQVNATVVRRDEKHIWRRCRKFSDRHAKQEKCENALLERMEFCDSIWLRVEWENRLARKIDAFLLEWKIIQRNENEPTILFWPIRGREKQKTV